MGMEALMRMLADGWPLALVGFAAGLLLGALMSRGKQNGERTPVRIAPGDDPFAALEAEIRTARDMLQAEEADAVATETTIRNLDSAIKRANGRLKLILKAVRREG